MKKQIRIAAIAVLVLLLTQCSNEKKHIAGVWKMTEMEINGTVLQGSSLGNWLWEFNDEGGYLFNVSGAVEKGKYELKENELSLQSVTIKERPVQKYVVTLLDSVNMQLSAVGEQNKTSLKFVKTAEGEMEERD